MKLKLKLDNRPTTDRDPRAGYAHGKTVLRDTAPNAEWRVVDDLATLAEGMRVSYEEDMRQAYGDHGSLIDCGHFYVAEGGEWEVQQIHQIHPDEGDIVEGFPSYVWGEGDEKIKLAYEASWEVQPIKVDGKGEFLVTAIVTAEVA